MGLTLAQQQLQHCCDALTTTGPDAPTLCRGWSTWDLAVHLWLLKHDPLAWPGIALDALAPLTARRVGAVKRRWPYDGLVARLRSEPTPIACMPLDRFENWRHCLGEYYVHTQDVVRANGLIQPPAGPELEDALWRRLTVAAPQLHPRRASGLVLVHPDGRELIVGRPQPTLAVAGPPSELICWTYGRTSAARVTVRHLSPDPPIPLRDRDPGFRRDDGGSGFRPRSAR